RAQSQTTDAAKTVNTYFDGHVQSLKNVGFFISITTIQQLRRTAAAAVSVALRPIDNASFEGVLTAIAVVRRQDFEKRMLVFLFQ
ncbi:hypothetical protein, partial [Rheinheimera riviphila]|uniref:hypothetical protein n=1 Tax=Rheinheimera riviphila TaxID=1834037 RepID=UPI00197EB6E8